MIDNVIIKELIVKSQKIDLQSYIDLINKIEL